MRRPTHHLNFFFLLLAIHLKAKWIRVHLNGNYIVCKYTTKHQCESGCHFIVACLHDHRNLADFSSKCKFKCKCKCIHSVEITIQIVPLDLNGVDGKLQLLLWLQIQRNDNFVTNTTMWLRNFQHKGRLCLRNCEIAKSHQMFSSKNILFNWSAHLNGVSSPVHFGAHQASCQWLCLLLLRSVHLIWDCDWVFCCANKSLIDSSKDTKFSQIKSKLQNKIVCGAITNSRFSSWRDKIILARKSPLCMLFERNFSDNFGSSVAVTIRRAIFCAEKNVEQKWMPQKKTW